MKYLCLSVTERGQNVGSYLASFDPGTQFVPSITPVINNPYESVLTNKTTTATTTTTTTAVASRILRWDKHVMPVDCKKAGTFTTIVRTCSIKPMYKTRPVCPRTVPHWTVQTDTRTENVCLDWARNPIIWASVSANNDKDDDEEDYPDGARIILYCSNYISGLTPADCQEPKCGIVDVELEIGM